MLSFLRIDPKSDLKFEGPFTEVVNADISLTNESNKLVCFKVKTTAPKQYCVRPNCGFVNPGETVPITVMLQPFNYIPNEKIKHKFLIQSMQVENDVATDNPELVWKDMKAEDIAEHKLRCVFEIGEKPDEEQLHQEKIALVAENRKLKEQSFPGKAEYFTTFSNQYSAPMNIRGAILIAFISILVGIIIGKFVI